MQQLLLLSSKHMVRQMTLNKVTLSLPANQHRQVKHEQHAHAVMMWNMKRSMASRRSGGHELPLALSVTISGSQDHTQIPPHNKNNNQQQKPTQRPGAEQNCWVARGGQGTGHQGGLGEV